MCGIAGIVMKSGPVAERGLDAMAGTLSHRGPEDRGHYVAGSVGLTHTRLSIIDLAGGHQPLFDDTRRFALVANGEVYNFVELRQELEALGRRFLTHSDSECALQGWAQWGEKSLERLNGMYAFALHDARTGEVVLARDRLGIKPLYVAELPDRILFASEIKTLLAVWGRTPEIEPQALAQFFGNQFSTGRKTIIRGIERLLPGEALRIGADLKTRRWRYWSALDVKPRAIGAADAEAEFESLFTQVMTEHMRSDVPYGLFLSGGVDSALLLATLRERHRHPIKTFSVGFVDAKLRDELDDADRIAKELGADHHPLRLSRDAIFRRLPLSVWAADDLMRDYACLPTLALAEHAGKDLKVVFSGEGGDEAFAGYRRYAPNWAETAFKRLRWPGSGGFRVRAELHPSWMRRLFQPALQAALGNLRAPFIEAWRQTPAAWSDMQRRQYTDLVTALPDDLLVKADRMLMAFSVEGRVPFLDHRVVEFGLSLPDGLKARRGAGKLILKKWGERRVPADHLWRKKRGFYVPVNEWLRGDFLRELARRLPQSPAIQQWCQPDAVRAVVARQADKGDVTREVWSLMQFAIWHRLFVGSDARRPPADADPLDWV